MQCHEFESRVQELLDERLPPADDAVLAAHAAICSSCRASLTAWSAMLEGVSARPRPTGRTNLAERVLADLRARPAATGWSSGPALRWATLATAAALLVAATVVLWNAIDNHPVANDAPSPGPQRAYMPPVVNSPVEPAMPTDLGTALADVWLLAPGVEESKSETATTQQVPQSSGWGPELAAGLRPLADSTTDAWDFLMTTLPAPADAAAELNGPAPAGADTPSVEDET